MSDFNLEEVFDIIIGTQHGTYIPQYFAESFWHYVQNKEEFNREVLLNPDNEWYWEEWDTVLRDAVLIDDNGEERFLDLLQPDGDVIAVLAKYRDEYYDAMEHWD